MRTMSKWMILSLLACIACGGSGGGGSSNAGRGPDSIQELVEEIPGTYYAVLRPVNIQSNGFIPYGQATFTMKEDRFEANVALDDDQPVTHRQAIHFGTRCPDAGDDKNKDGFIDYKEALKVVGREFIPLDGDLNSVGAGEGIYPRGRAMTYNRVGSVQRMKSDLPSGMGLGLKKRVVLVHGTSERADFPSTIATRDGETAGQSLPVVCGVLEQIDL